jgi:DNA modification methylase
MKLKDIKPNPNNPRVLRDDKFQKLKQSITEFPKMLSLRPMVIDENNVVLGGNMRLRALQELGFTDVEEAWVKRSSDLTEQEKKRFIIADNVAFGEWDWDTLANDWEVVDLEAWGLEIPQFDNEAEELEASEDDYDVPEGGIETDIVIGDLFQIGEHRLLCGDSTDSDTVARLMNGEKADMVFTDPPYNANYKSRGKDVDLREGIKNDNMSDDAFEDFIKAFISTTLLAIKDGASLYYCCNWKDSYPRFYFNLQEAGINISANIVWNKGSGGMGWQDYRFQYEFIIYGFKKGAAHSWYAGRSETDIWDFNRDGRSEYKHPTQKPIQLSSKAILNSSKSDDLVLDLFLGSGSTMAAAHQLKRRCFGMELDPRYCQVIIDRMKKLDSTLIIKRNGVVI